MHNYQLCATVCKEDLKMATTIKDNRESRGRRCNSPGGNEARYSDSSFFVKLWSPSLFTDGTRQIQVLSPTQSESSLSLAKRIAKEIGVEFESTNVESRPNGAIGEVK